MRLVLQEYLAMLKESGELDVLLPDLLSAMGINPLSRPGRGARQYGVDVAAVGVDPIDGVRRLFLVTIKRGDITRSVWDSGPDTVRPSINEIVDVYLPNHVAAEHHALPRKIVLATGGEMRQEVELNWTSFVNGFARRVSDEPTLDFEFWGGPRIADLIEVYLLDEYLFPEGARSRLRKTIALADQNESEPTQFYDLVEDVLFGATEPSLNRDRKALVVVTLSTSLVAVWSRDVGNSLNGVVCAEHAVLRCWDWLRTRGYLDVPDFSASFARLYGVYIDAIREYFKRVEPFCRVRDGLFGWGGDEVEYPLRVLETGGILGLLVLGLLRASEMADADDDREDLVDEARQVSAVLGEMLSNNRGGATPVYDGHAIEIAIMLLALVKSGRDSEAQAFLGELAWRVPFGRAVRQRFPVATDRYEDLVALSFGEPVDWEQITAFSTLVPVLAGWIGRIAGEAGYSAFRGAIESAFQGTNLQVWYPDADSEAVYLSENAADATGVTEASLVLPKAAIDWAEMLQEASGRLEGAFGGFSFVVRDWGVLGLVASRHFRTPVVSRYWRRESASEDALPEPADSTTDSDGGRGASA